MHVVSNGGRGALRLGNESIIAALLRVSEMELLVVYDDEHAVCVWRV